ncbi:MAG TPA: nucleotide sugar dehydrogenase [Candidatus Paceibacterota bacterium]|nr:nucleotide sugar dehydrogenase [Candidatus Paceibacterota bacterium]
MKTKTTKKKLPRLSVVGLGKLGACYAAFLTRSGFEVLGFDVDEHKVASIEAGKAPVPEPGLQDYITAARGRLSATTDMDRLIAETDITFIIVPTPSEKSGLFSVDYVAAAARTMGPALRRKKGWHTFVLVSTVLPGDSRERIIPEFERASGKVCGRDFGYVYSPSLIAIGDILNNLERPDFVFLGAHDGRAGDAVEGIFTTLYPGSQAIERMSVESAELAKIALNSFLTMKISFANGLAAIASRIPNADVDEITNAIGKDSRIGRKFLKAGLGFGGPCFPRDNRAFYAMAKRRGFTAHLARSTDILNQTMEESMYALLEEHAGSKRDVVGFLGISYKPKTTHGEASQALALVERMLRNRYRVAVFEPLGSAEAQTLLGTSVLHVPTLADLARQSSVIFVSNPDPLFSELPALLAKAKKRTVVIDPWGMFDARALPKHVMYVAHGRRAAAAKLRQ